LNFLKKYYEGHAQVNRLLFITLSTTKFGLKFFIISMPYQMPKLVFIKFPDFLLTNSHKLRKLFP